MGDPTMGQEHLAALYHRAFIAHGASALWSMQPVDDPTDAEALAITVLLKTHGGSEGRRIAEKIEKLCAAPASDTDSASAPMNIAQLIEHLRTFPPDMPVLVEGYESGWDAIREVRSANVVHFHNAQRWDGKYAEVSEFEHAEQGASVVLIVGCREM